MIGSILFYLLIGIGVASLFLNPRWKFLWLWFPFAYGGVYALYEVWMRHEIPLESVPIRLDLLLIYPMLGFVCLAWVVKCVISSCKEFNK